MWEYGCSHVGLGSFVYIATDPAVLTPKGVNCCVTLWATHVMCACVCVIACLEGNRHKSSYGIISGSVMR